MIADVSIYETGTGGDLILNNDDIATTGGLYNQVYLGVMGGNVNQSTSDDLNELDQRFDFWGNAYLNEENQFNSITQRTLKEVALNSGGLSTIENAVIQDLKFLEEYADIEVEASILGVDRVQININVIQPNNQSLKVKFIWDGTAETLIEDVVI